VRMFSRQLTRTQARMLEARAFQFFRALWHRSRPAFFSPFFFYARAAGGKGILLAIFRGRRGGDILYSFPFFLPHRAECLRLTLRNTFFSNLGQAYTNLTITLFHERPDRLFFFFFGCRGMLRSIPAHRTCTFVRHSTFLLPGLFEGAVNGLSLFFLSSSTLCTRPGDGAAFPHLHNARLSSLFYHATSMAIFFSLFLLLFFSPLRSTVGYIRRRAPPQTVPQMESGRPGHLSFSSAGRHGWLFFFPFFPPDAGRGPARRSPKAAPRRIGAGTPLPHWKEGGPPFPFFLGSLRHLPCPALPLVLRGGQVERIFLFLFFLHERDGETASPFFFFSSRTKTSGARLRAVGFSSLAPLYLPGSYTRSCEGILFFLSASPIFRRS